MNILQKLAQELGVLPREVERTIRCRAANGTLIETPLVSQWLVIMTSCADEGVRSPGVQRIVVERGRQIAREGWTPAHDDEHTDGSLAIAAACYAVAGDPNVRVTRAHGWPSNDAWPWQGWDKREKHDRIRRLEIAGALIAAEIDRLLRAQEHAAEDGPHDRPGVLDAHGRE